MKKKESKWQSYGRRTRDTLKWPTKRELNGGRKNFHIDFERSPDRRKSEEERDENTSRVAGGWAGEGLPINSLKIRRKKISPGYYEKLAALICRKVVISFTKEEFIIRS